MIDDFKMPAARAVDLIAKASAFRRRGDLVTATLSPDVAGAFLNADVPPRRAGRGGNPFDAPIKDPRGSVTFRVEAAVLTEFTLSLSGSRATLRQRGPARPDDHHEDHRHRLREGRGPGGRSGDRRGARRRGRAQGLRARARVPQAVRRPEPRRLGRAAGVLVREDRAIVGRTTKENPTRGNMFLFAKSAGKDLIVDDFELRLPTGSPRTTTPASPTRASSTAAETGAASWRPATRRTSRCARGSRASSMTRRAVPAAGESWPSWPKVTWTSEGRKQMSGRLGSSEEIGAKIKKDDWNEYVVIARGNHLQHFINGVATVDVHDDSQAKRLDSGILGLQLHAGQPMTVRFKDIRIKSLRSAAESAAGNLRVAKGFKLDQIYSVPKATQGSWVALCVDPKGRLIAADQNGKLYRMTTPTPGRGGSIEPEAIGVDLAGVHGLLCASIASMRW